MLEIKILQSSYELFLVSWGVIFEGLGLQMMARLNVG